jgi:GMP synthase (glutamine-hydrolysing)
LGGRVAPATQREYGHAALQLAADAKVPILRGLPGHPSVWMSHGDQVIELPPGFQPLASTENSPVAAMANDRGLVGLQFHPEVAHTPQGIRILQNFCYELAGCRPTWTTGSFIAEAVEHVRTQVGGGRVLLAFSGGVDSAVAAALLHRAVGDQLTCVFVDNGLLRKGEADAVATTFRRHLNFNLRVIDAGAEFLGALAGVTDPETKRQRIGERFVRVFEREAKRLEAEQGPFEFLAQGTIYPDVIESAAPERKAAARIKTHHNVGGLPLDMRLRLVEPLRYLFKDEVRAAGSELGLPDEVVWRQPFPGPGLAVRVLGEVTTDRLAVLREADAIVLEEIQAAGWQRQLGQWFAVLTPLQTTGVMGDFRTYGYLVAVRAVVTTDFMTVDWAPLPHDLLGRIANRIVNEVPGVNRVVYDITSKPPATVEWE